MKFTDDFPFSTPEEAEAGRDELLNEVFRGTASVLGGSLLCNFLVFAVKQKINYEAEAREDAETGKFHEEIAIVSNMCTRDILSLVDLLQNEVQGRNERMPFNGEQRKLDS